MLPRYFLVTIALAACTPPTQIQPAHPTVECSQCDAKTTLAVGMPFQMELAWSAVCDERHVAWDSHNDGSTQDIHWRHQESKCHGREFTYRIDCDNCQAGETRRTSDDPTYVSVVPSSAGPFQVRVEIRAGTDRFVWIGPPMTAVRAELELWCAIDGEPLAPCGDRELDLHDTYIAVVAPGVDGPHFLEAHDMVSIVGIQTLMWGPIPSDAYGRTGVKLDDRVTPGTRAVGLQWGSVKTAKTITIAS